MHMDASLALMHIYAQLPRFPAGNCRTTSPHLYRHGESSARPHESLERCNPGFPELSQRSGAARPRSGQVGSSCRLGPGLHCLSGSDESQETRRLGCNSSVLVPSVFLGVCWVCCFVCVVFFGGCWFGL